MTTEPQHRTLRLSGSPTQLRIEVAHRRVRSKRLFGAPWLLLFNLQQSFAMNYCGNRHHLILDLINDAIAISEPLTNVFIAYLRHNPTREWKPNQIPCA